MPRTGNRDVGAGDGGHHIGIAVPFVPDMRVFSTLLQEKPLPAAFEIDANERIVRMRAWGAYCNADLRDYYHGVVADARFNRSFRCLVNLSGVKIFALDSCVIAEVASWAVFSPGTRRAIVAPSDVAFGLSRMFSLHAEGVGQNVMVFRTELAADVWLSTGFGHDVGPVPAEVWQPQMRVA